MSNYICTIYAHEASFDLVTNEAKKLFPDAEWSYERRNEFTDATLIIKGGIFRPKKKLKITYREREKFSHSLSSPDCPVCSNLLGMKKMVENIQTNKSLVQSSLLKKIETINAEFSITMLENSEKEFKALVQHLAFTLDAFVFAQPRTGLMNSLHQAFLDKDLALILDVEGRTDVEDLEITINSKYFDSKDSELTSQLNRKEKSTKIIESLGLAINPNLPAIVEDSEADLRTAKEVAERITALALTNLVAFNNIPGDQAIQFASKSEIIDLLSPLEIEFLKHPSKEAKQHETWKCESIWTLFWALGIVDNLEPGSSLADLTKIPENSYPIGSSIKPLEFIEKQKSLRPISEILDATDLYYRVHWACKEAKSKNENVSSVHPGVVYERHYALNWLINYRKQEWDNVSTDT